MEQRVPVTHVDVGMKHLDELSELIQLVEPLACLCGRQTTSALIWPDEPGVYQMQSTCPTCYQRYQADLVRLHDVEAD